MLYVQIWMIDCSATRIMTNKTKDCDEKPRKGFFARLFRGAIKQQKPSPPTSHIKSVMKNKSSEQVRPVVEKSKDAPDDEGSNDLYDNVSIVGDSADELPPPPKTDKDIKEPTPKLEIERGERNSKERRGKSMNGIGRGGNVPKGQRCRSLERMQPKSSVGTGLKKH